MAVGLGWAKLSPAQKEAVTGAFARYITATYADNFDHYSITFTHHTSSACARLRGSTSALSPLLYHHAIAPRGVGSRDVREGGDR
jgi:hypothetical protein